MINNFSGFSHIMDSIEITAKLPFEIVPNHWLRKAEKKEIEEIKGVITTQNALQNPAILYEFEHIESRKDSGGYNMLPPENWRYYVISFDKDNSQLRKIEYAFNLAKNDISLGYIFFTGMVGAVGYDLSLISNFYADRYMLVNQTKIIGEDEIKEINNYYNLIVGLDIERYKNVSRAIEEFHRTKCITNRSAFKIFSYFAIIECLLTHSPLPSDITDSTTRQITGKMCLLSKRFQRDVHYKSFFPKIDELEKVWRKLYSFRSNIAHGENTDFKKEFLVLNSRDNIRLFLMENIKLLLLYTLKDPEFVADLQKC
jgi:hypothetical protein